MDEGVNSWLEERTKSVEVFNGYPALLAVYHTWLTTGMDTRTGPAQTRYTFEELALFIRGEDLQVLAIHQLAAVVNAQTVQMKTWMEAIYEEIRQYTGWRQGGHD